MNRQQFQEYLIDPSQLNDLSVSELKQVVETFPWFQTAHLLYAKALSNTNHFDYYNSLKRTSIAVNDRRMLYELIRQETTTREQLSSDNQVQIAAHQTDKPEELNVSAKNVVTENLISSDIEEIKFVSNSTSGNLNNEVQIEKVEKQVEIGSEKENYKVTQRIELLVTTKQERDEKVANSPQEIQKIEESVLPPPQSAAQPKNNEQIRPPVIDEIILNPVVNAYIEKEILQVTEIHKPAPEFDAAPFSENSEKARSVLKESLNEPHSFTEWLKLLAQQKNQKAAIHDTDLAGNTNTITPLEFEVSKSVQQNNDEKRKRLEIMDKIIQNEPGHIRMSDSPEFFNPSKSARGSNREDEALVTETLAWIYEQQGNYAKAIRAYQTLSLKFPEKSVYFASLIQKIKLKQKQK